MYSKCCTNQWLAPPHLQLSLFDTLSPVLQAGRHKVTGRMCSLGERSRGWGWLGYSTTSGSIAYTFYAYLHTYVSAYSTSKMHAQSYCVYDLYGAYGIIHIVNTVLIVYTVHMVHMVYMGYTVHNMVERKNSTPQVYSTYGAYGLYGVYDT